MIEKITETAQKEVNFLEDVEVEWISLVDHGANRAPFKIIKAEVSKKEEVMQEIIQSVIVPNSTEIEEVRKTCDWLNGVQIIKVDKFDTYTKHTQIPVDKFDKESFRLKKMEDSGTVIIFGDLLEPNPDAVSVKKEEKISCSSYVESFADIAYFEFSNLASIIAGTLQISDMDNTTKKSIISSSLDAFKTFISAGLDNAQDPMVVKVDISKNEREVIMDKVENTQETPIKDEPTFNLEEAVTAMVSKMDTVLEKFVDSNFSAAIPGPNETNQVPQVPGGATDESSMFGANPRADAVIAAISKLTEMVEKLSEKLDKMDSVVQEPAASNETNAPVKKSEDASDTFRGAIFRR